VNAASDSTATATTATAEGYVGRFAPSPTGRLHAGSLVSAVASFLDARAASGRWLVRIEDIDAARVVPGAADQILTTLETHGLHWDGPVRYQSTRLEAYEDARSTLERQGRLYRCTCRRGDYAGTRYPGTCRDRSIGPDTPHAWRLNTAGVAPITVHDRVEPPLVEDVEATVGDFILHRRDGAPAYQLAVVVDDGDQGVTDIVRGLDLYDNTPRQRLLQHFLALPHPTTLHHPLVYAEDGEKLSKSKAALEVQPRAASANLVRALTHLNHPPPAELSGAPPEELLSFAIAAWDPSRLREPT
jgi:glutamyl-Q tRNA(Asp) synthetase